MYHKAAIEPEPTSEPFFLLPNDIKLDARFDVRPFSSREETTDEEDRLIELLAISMEENGQLEDVLITPEHILFAGHRRRKAAILINQQRTAKFQSLFKLRCRIDASGGDLRRKAIQSNVQRKEITPMDLAFLITQIRNENQWQGRSGTIHVAKYIGKDPATVTQHERFLTAQKELQNQLHLGVITAQSMLDLLKIPAEKRLPTVVLAGEIQQKDKVDKVLDDFVDGKRDVKQTKRSIDSASKHTRIEHPAIVKAIRKQGLVVQVNSRKLSLTRSALIESIKQFDSPRYSPPAREFARYWSETLAPGHGSMEELAAKFAVLDQHNVSRSKAKAS